jgi:nitrite reductase/ring-hydroxylating ferredoxin subunit
VGFKLASEFGAAMIAQEENNLLTRTGRGTPCGELMRRHWQPAALSEELTADKPLPVTLFGEELILFRDDQGNPALIGRYCAHQGVDMIYGRVEPGGIRCMYHGWLFDNCGKVVVRGDWLPGGEQRMSVGQPAYPCLETGGVILTYMGPGEAPALPAYEFLVKPPARFALTKVRRDENYLQGILRADKPALNGAKFVMPNLVAHQGAPSGTESWVRWHVPLDDNSHEEFTFRYFGESPIAGGLLSAGYQVLLKAIDEILTQRGSLESAAKDL